MDVTSDGLLALRAFFGNDQLRVRPFAPHALSLSTLPVRIRLILQAQHGFVVDVPLVKQCTCHQRRRHL